MPHAPPTLDRRAFLRRATDALACAAAIRAFAAPGAWAMTDDRPVSPRLRIGVVTSGQSNARATASLGVELGIVEAHRAASLLGGTVDVPSRAESVPAGIALISHNNLSAVICSASADEIVALGRACESAATPLFNVSAADDSLRAARCSRFTFHVCASDAMCQSALGALAKSSGKPDTTIELWDHRLERFGAAQLNDRFRSRARQPMDSLAWAGWFAVKVAWEASIRARATDGAGTVAYLERETTQFDGQKGIPLSFRQWDHQLRQPLYAVAAASEPISIPALSAGSSRDELDVLGTNREASACHWR